MSSSSSPPPSPSRKSLIADAKLKSMSTLPDPSNLASKRTRDRPNLSDCHGCGRHVDHTNPKTRLRLLDSFWRIVLLCKKCLNHVRSGKICPYCLKLTEKSCDLVECASCSCRVHTVCVRGFEDIASGVGYLGLNGDFRVCVDCWVPDSLRRYCGKVNCEGKGKSSELDEMKKVKGKILGKKASGNGPVELVCRKKKSRNLGGEQEGVENDARLAIQLHKKMNSSSRILKNNCLMDGTNGSGGLRIRKWKGLTYKRLRLGKKLEEAVRVGSCGNNRENYTSFGGEESKPVLLVYKRDRQRKIWDLDEEYVVSGESMCMKIPGLLDGRTLMHENKHGEAENFQTFSYNGANRLKSGILQYRRDKKRKIWRLNDENQLLGASRSSELGASGFKSDSDYCSSKCLIEGNSDILDYPSCYNSDKSNSGPSVGRFGPDTVVYKRRTNLCTVNFMARISRDCLIQCHSGVYLPHGNCNEEQDCCSPKSAKREGPKSDSSCLHSDNFACFK